MLKALNGSLTAKFTSWFLIQTLCVTPSLSAFAALVNPGESLTEATAELKGVVPRAPAAGASYGVGAGITDDAAAAGELALPQPGDAVTVAAPLSVSWLNPAPGASKDAAWALFDGDPNTVLRSLSGAPLRVEVTFPSAVWLQQVTGFGHTRGALSVSVGDPAHERAVSGLEARHLVLAGGFGPLTLALPTLAERVVLEWTPGDEQGLAELALWQTIDPVRLLPEQRWAARLGRGSFPGALEFTSERASARVGDPGADGATASGAQSFDFTVSAEPKSLSRAFLVYELEGVSSFTGAPRRLNEHASRADVARGVSSDSALSPERLRAGLQVEELNPAWLLRGSNRIEFGAPKSSVARGPVSSYRVSHVRVVGIPNGGAYAVVPPSELSAGFTPNLPASQRAKAATTAATRAQTKQAWQVEFSSPTVPHSVGFRLREATPGKLIVATVDGKKRLEIPLAGLSAGWHAWDAGSVFGAVTALRLSAQNAPRAARPHSAQAALSVSDLRVTGSPVPEHERPAVRVSYPLAGECSFNEAYVRGFVTGLDKQLLSLTVDGKALPESALAADGSFEFTVPEAPGSGAGSTLALAAKFRDGSAVTQSVQLGRCDARNASLDASKPIADVGAPYGEWVTPDAAATLHYAGAILELPKGAVSEPVRITIRPLPRDQASPSQSGVVNVVPGQGSFRFGPAGLRFKEPVRVTLPYDRKELPGPATEQHISSMYFDAPVAVWRAIPKLGSASAGVIVSETDHFTEFMNATLPAPDAPGPKNSSPDSMQGIELGSPSAAVDLIEAPTANPQRTANLSYPLRVPPGRNGLAPELALSYSSARGNGWLGMGWDLPLSSLELDTRFGVPDYDGSHIQGAYPDSLAGSLRYILDGAQLTPQGLVNGGERFVRRVEGGYERILQLSSPADPTIKYWEVTDKSGVKSVYGASPNSRLADPNEPTRIFKWNLERVEDAFGNQIVFRYFQDVQSMPGPNATAGVQMPQIYPKRICYGQIQSATADDCSGTYTISFVLDGGNVRADRMIDARAGFPVKTVYRLESVVVAHESAPIRSYDLRFDTGAFQKTLLKTVAMLGSGGSELYHHDFEYQGANPTEQAFAPAREWGSVKNAGGMQTERGLSRTKGSTSGGGGGLGLDFVFAGASVSAGLMSGNNQVLAAPVEVSGDGVLDFLLSNGAGSLNREPRNELAAFDHLAFSAVPNLSGKSLGYTKSGGWTAGGSVSIIGGDLGGNVAHNEVDDRNILADLNGDGFVDLVRVAGGKVKYKPGHKDGFLAEADYGDYDDALITYANSERTNNQKSVHYLIDPIARWKAPFAGQVEIAGAIQKQLPGGDGVIVSILKNDDPLPLWTRQFGGADTAACVPSAGGSCNGAMPLVTPIALDDDLYFRVSSIDDTEKDIVEWSPSISYQGISPTRVDDREVYGSFVYRTSLADDFRLVGQPKRPWVPSAPGTVHVLVTYDDKQPMADDVVVEMFKAPADIVDPTLAPLHLTTTVSANATGTQVLFDQTIAVEESDILFFQMSSDSPVDPARLGLNAQVEYVEYSRPDPNVEPSIYVSGPILGCSADAEGFRTCQMGNDPTPEDPVPESLIKQRAEINTDIHIWDAGSPTTVLTAGGAVTAGTLAKGPTSDRVCALVQGVHRLFSKACLDANATGPVTLPMPTGITAGEPLYFTIISKSALTLVNGGGLLLAGQVAWEGSSAGLANINVRHLDPNFGDTLAPSLTHDMMAGGYHRWSFGDYRGDRSIDESAFQKRGVDVQEPSFFFGTAASTGTLTYAGPAYTGRGQNVFVAADAFSPGRIKGLNGFTSADGEVGALRLADTWSYGINAGAFGLSVGLGAADTTGVLEFMDMNGDNLPDLVARDGVAFNTGAEFTPKGGHNAGEFRFVTQKSARAKAELSFDLSGGVEHDQTIPITDTEGKTRSVLGTSFSVGLDYALSSANTELVDINQDGLPDLLEFKPTAADPQMTVRLNTGYGFTERIEWLNPSSGFQEFGWQTDVLEGLNAITGKILDRHVGAHAARFEDTGSLSAGISVGGEISVGIFGGGGHVGKGWVTSLNRQAVDFIDLNNDGLVDHVSRGPDDDFLRVRLNLGDHFATEESWPLPSWGTQQGVDVEGDINSLATNILSKALTSGKTGALGFSHSRDYSYTFDAKVCFLFVCASGYGFSSKTSGGSEVAFKDVNGDGLVDHIAKLDGNEKLYVKLNTLGQANLLTGVVRPFNGKIALSYARYGNEVVETTVQERPVDLPSNSYALVKVEVLDGRGQTLAQSFDYTDQSVTPAQQTGKYDRVERDDYGSAAVTTTRGVAGSTGDGSQLVTRYHNQDFWRRGLSTEALERDAAGAVFTRVSYLYEDPSSSMLQAQPEPYHGSFFPAETERRTEWFEGGPTAGKATSEHRTWNFSHGGLLTLKMDADEGSADDLFYSVSYDERPIGNDPNALYLVRPSRVVVRQGSNTGPVLRDRESTYDARGALATFTNRITGGGIPGGAGSYNNAASTLTLTRDGVGNIATLTDANGYRLTYTYDSTGIYQVGVSDSHGSASSSQPNYLFGGVTVTTDENGHSAFYEYDSFGRLTAVWGPNDFSADPLVRAATAPTLKAEYALGSATPPPSPQPFWAKVGHKDIARNLPGTPVAAHDYVETVTFIDGFERVIQTKKDLEKDFINRTDVGFTVSGKVEFDERGRLRRQGQPLFRTLGAEPAAQFVDIASVEPAWADRATTMTYDILGRVTHQSIPSDFEDIGQDFVASSTVYDFGVDVGGITRFRTTVTDAKGRSSVQHRDVMDHVLEVIERANSVGGSPIRTRYRYNPVGDLLEVIDAQSHVTSASYDSVGRMVSLNSPDAGTTTWKYDLVGNVRRKATPSLRAGGDEIVYDYDFNRLRQINYPESDPRVFIYGTNAQKGDLNGNGTGRIISELSEAGERNFRYDRMGNVSQLDTTFQRLREPHRGPYRYQVKYEYDSFERRLKMRYPDLRGESNPDEMALGDASAELISYTYDAGGNLQSIFGLNTRINEQHPDEEPNTIYLAHLGYDEFGQKVRLISGNFIETIYQYKTRTRRLAHVNADHRDVYLRQQNKPARPFQRLGYTYDAVGNVTHLENAAPYDEQMNASVLVGNLKHNYSYDSLDRLTHADGTVQVRRDWRHRYAQDFTYDDIHNVKTKQNQSFRQVPDGNGGFRDDSVIREQTYEARYSYEGPRPHAVTNISEQLPAESLRFERNYDYDANGNQTEWTYRGSDTREIKWNEDDLVKEVYLNTQLRSQNLYDAEGQRAVSLHYVTGLEETAYHSQDLTIRDGQYLTKHVFAGDALLADKMDSAWLNYPPTLYYHPDHLGSTQYSSNQEQILTQHDEYFPSGELWRDETDSRYELARRFVFNGKEVDLGTGLHYYGARFYDGRQSQWLSPDPILARYMTGSINHGVFQARNLATYAYGWNNPVNLIDANGLAVGDAWYKRLGKGALGVAFGTLQSIAPGGFLTDFVARPTNDSDFLVGQAAGQYATGGVQLITGGAAAAAGGGGTVVTAGAGSLVTIPVAAAGVAVAVQGATNVAAATNTLMQAQKAREAELLQMSGNGTGGGGGKGTGSYTNTHASGKTYDGKGGPERSSASGRRVQQETGDPHVATEWTPAKNSREAFKQESRRLDSHGGPSSPDNYNKIESPGKKMRAQDGDH